MSASSSNATTFKLQFINLEGIFLPVRPISFIISPLTSTQPQVIQFLPTSFRFECNDSFPSARAKAWACLDANDEKGVCFDYLIAFDTKENAHRSPSQSYLCNDHHGPHYLYTTLPASSVSCSLLIDIHFTSSSRQRRQCLLNGHMENIQKTRRGRVLSTEDSEGKIVPYNCLDTWVINSVGLNHPQRYCILGRSTVPRQILTSTFSHRIEYTCFLNKTTRKSLHHTDSACFPTNTTTTVFFSTTTSHTMPTSLFPDVAPPLCEKWSQCAINKTHRLLLAPDLFDLLLRTSLSLSPMSGDNPKFSETAKVIFKKLKAGKRYLCKSVYVFVSSIKTCSSNRRLKPYLMKARWIAQSIHPFVNIRRVFYAGVPEGFLDSGDEDGEEQE